MSTVRTPAAPTQPLVQDPAFRTRADQVYAQLKRDVAEFSLVPGDRFTENEISERLGVSRTPVRQALFRLQQEGFVEVLFRSGWRVLHFDFDQFEQLYDLRMVLETTAVHRLCESDHRVDRSLLDSLAGIWLVPIAQRSADTVQVREATGVRRDLKQKDIETRVKQDQSMMPVGLADNLTPEQLADLIAYLQSLK